MRIHQPVSSEKRGNNPTRNSSWKITIFRSWLLFISWTNVNIPLLRYFLTSIIGLARIAPFIFGNSFQEPYYFVENSFSLVSSRWKDVVLVNVRMIEQKKCGMGWSITGRLLFNRNFEFAFVFLRSLPPAASKPISREQPHVHPSREIGPLVFGH